MEKKYCMMCKQLIRLRPKGIKGLLSKNHMELYEFEDGFYCGVCAEIRVNNIRGIK